MINISLKQKNTLKKDGMENEKKLTSQERLLKEGTNLFNHYFTEDEFEIIVENNKFCIKFSFLEELDVTIDYTNFGAIDTHSFLSEDYLVNMIIFKAQEVVFDKIKNLSIEEAEKCVPKGCYCYDDKGSCPFNSSKYIQTEDGVVRLDHCLYLDATDCHCSDEDFEKLKKHFNCTDEEIWNKFDLDLLWDECKCCNLNDDYRHRDLYTNY